MGKKIIIKESIINRMYEYFKDGYTIDEISKIFLYHKIKIGRTLKKRYGEKYEKIVKLHMKRARSLNMQLLNKKPRTINQIEASKINVKRAIKLAQKLPRTEKQIQHSKDNFSKTKTTKQLEASRENGKKVGAWCLENRNYISSWENKFYGRLLNYFDKLEIKRQFYLKDLQHPFDFAIPSLKLLIEIDGNYFHSLPGRAERDAVINEFVRENYSDWVLFRFNDEILKEANII